MGDSPSRRWPAPRWPPAPRIRRRRPPRRSRRRSRGRAAAVGLREAARRRRPRAARCPGSEQDFVINIGDRVYFDFDKATIRADAGPILDGQAGWLRRYPEVRVRIEGNCDERGTREYNFALGARRADAVRDYLVAHGVAAGRIATISYGKEQPIDPGHDETAWAKNRNARTAITEGAR